MSSSPYALPPEDLDVIRKYIDEQCDKNALALLKYYIPIMNEKTVIELANRGRGNSEPEQRANAFKKAVDAIVYTYNAGSLWDCIELLEGNVSAAQ